ncbi:MAG: glycoside hydrolase family 3 C-terminal domain-containing protein, partial [Muribaculaceae bacterium]|nr:glycoside hydrolase family 3 C-terminal domain-containing protein [Muribaculaceae bacterium]
LGYASGNPDYSRELPAPYDADSLRLAAIETARKADAVVFFGGLNKNYRQDCEGEDRASFGLPFGQDSLIAAIREANPMTAVVIVSGNAVAMPWADSVPAIVQSWYLGSMGGAALADIISGDHNPGGKLPFSIPARLADCAAHSFGQRAYPGIDADVHYDEGLLVGYRWHDTRKIPARFPFGHGLSYTTFRYSGLSADRKEYLPTDTVTVTLRLENTGKAAGSETVQFYASQKSPRLPRPAKELKAFRKTSLVPGEATTVTASIPVSDLAYYDDNLGRWVVDNDEFTIHAGSSSTDIRCKTTFRINDKQTASNK